MPKPATLQQLMEAAVHFGHKTQRWNPKMRSFLLKDKDTRQPVVRNGIHILDLSADGPAPQRGEPFVSNLTANGESILFVGTKKQAQDAIQEEAERSGQFYVNQRWLGGMLTNFQTIQVRIRYMKDLERARRVASSSASPRRKRSSARTSLSASAARSAASAICAACLARSSWWTRRKSTLRSWRRAAWRFR